jgi:hypothetical protein
VHEDPAWLPNLAQDPCSPTSRTPRRDAPHQCITVYLRLPRAVTSTAPLHNLPLSPPEPRRRATSCPSSSFNRSTPELLPGKTSTETRMPPLSALDLCIFRVCNLSSILTLPFSVSGTFEEIAFVELCHRRGPSVPALRSLGRDHGLSSAHASEAPGRATSSPAITAPRSHRPRAPRGELPESPSSPSLASRSVHSRACLASLEHAF